MNILLERSSFRYAVTGAAILSILLGAREVTAAQSQGTAAGTDVPAVPFGAGERALYQVKLGAFTVGEGAMEVLGTERVNGHLTYHTRLSVEGGIPFARVDDTFESWIDVDGLFSRRFKQDQHEINYDRERVYDFYPDRGYYRRRDNGEIKPLPTDKPLDDVSFLFYARTLPLKVGETYEIERYFKESGNPVVLKVVRKETIEVPAGKFNTIVVRPIIKTDGLFGEGGEAEIYFTDDSRRIMVQLTTKVPIVGSLNLYLKDYRPGEPLSRATGSQAGPGK
ncbi:MAG TPA: DUF3108 domain-containing protein [Longimicrobiaceae bacterium]|nr:DUF3108 domain-containing protein [Longimicrobiaceae bacterium]